MEIKNLVKIVQMAQNGEKNAQQILYLNSSKSVYFLALKILKSPDDAEDIMQDIFITIFDKLPTLKQPAAYYKWINQIAANKCMNFLRKKKPILYKDQDILDALESDEDVSAPEKLYDNEETRRLIRDIIDTLPDAQRICVLYRYFSQLSIKEIASITKTNKHTVKSRLALARQKICAAILEKEKNEGIRLHAIIPITPVLMKSLEDFRMPEGLTERIWKKITEGVGNAVGNTATTSEEAGVDVRTSRQFDPKLGGDRTHRVTKYAISLSTKVTVIVAGILAASGIITGIWLTQPSKMNTTSDPLIAATVSVRPSEQPSVQSSEPSTQPSEQEPTPSVEDYAQYYAPVLEEYRACSLGNAEDAGMFLEAFIYAENPETDFGYALQDLNGNGIPELILLSKYDPYICAVYSLVDNTPHLLDSFWTRYTCDIDVNGILYIHGSGGAFDSYTASYIIAPDGTSLILIEEVGIESYDTAAGQHLDVPRYYKIDANGAKTIISEDEATSAWQKLDEAKVNKWDLAFISLW